MIMNLTQHAATPDQIEAGVFNFQGFEKDTLVEALTFQDLPAPEEIRERARTIAGIAARWKSGVEHWSKSSWVGGAAPERTRAMIGGAPYLMPALERELRAAGIDPIYAFTRREVEEQAQPDGTVKKVAVFRHAGWVPAL